LAALLHSLADTDRLPECFHQTPPDWPFILHLAEGTDLASQREFYVLEQHPPLDKRVVLVHCVATELGTMGNSHALQNRHCLVPVIESLTLGGTLIAKQVLILPNVALETDSPRIVTRDLLDEVSFVHDELRVPDPLVYDLVTVKAALLSRLRRGEGNPQTAAKADLIVVNDRELTPAGHWFRYAGVMLSL
jgi:hypothetical protein